MDMMNDIEKIDYMHAQMTQPMVCAPTEPAEGSSISVQSLKERIEKLENGYREIIKLGGNFADYTLVGATNAQDARTRGQLYIACRKIAENLLK